MPSVSYLLAITAASLAPGDSGLDGTQIQEIRNSRLALGPPCGSFPHSPPPAVWPILPQPLLHRLPKPLLARVRIHKNHQIIGKSRVFDCRPPLVAGRCFRPLQHLVHLIEVQITEQRRNHSSYANDNRRSWRERRPALAAAHSNPARSAGWESNGGW